LFKSQEPAKKLDHPYNVLLSHNITTHKLKEQEKEKKRNQQKGPALLVPENMGKSQPPSR
jgi:hypothetical protein